MPVIHASEAPRFELPGAEFTVFAAPSLGSADICTWRLTLAPGRDPGEPHTLDQDEIFMVISGSVRITPDGPALGPGDAAIVPADEPILVTNLGEAPAELHVAVRSGFTATMADGTKVNPPWAQ
jgi:mannose-6-phosphate isomerase-like protein (cupin superfamily)